MKIRCIIVDDEQPALDELAYLLSFYEDVIIVDKANSATSAISSIKKHKPDLVFLDIQMPGGSGFDVMAEFKDSEESPFVIFATAYDQYAIKAFEEHAVDYVLKPFSGERIGKSIERVKKLLESDSKNSVKDELYSLIESLGKKREVTKIAVESKGRIVLLSQEEIVFFQYEDRKIKVHTTSDTFSLYGISTMDKLEKHLKSELFFRCHRVTIVNLNHIREFSPWFNGKYVLKMDDNESSEAVVSRTKVKDFKTLLGI